MGEITQLPTGEDGLEPSADQNACDFLSFIALNFNSSFFDRTASAAGFLHLAGEFFFFRQTDPNEISYDSDSFTSPAGSVANDIDAAAVFVRDRICGHEQMLHQRPGGCNRVFGQRGHSFSLALRGPHLQFGPHVG